MQLIIIKTIFLILINIGTIVYPVSVNSLELLNPNTIQEVKKRSLQLQNIEIFNLTEIEIDYLYKMAKYAEESMVNVDYRIFGLLYPVGEQLTPEQPLNNKTGFRGPTHEIVLNVEQKKEMIIELANFLKKSKCNDDLTFTFGEKLQAGTGNIIINDEDGSTIKTINVNSPNVVFRDYQIIINNASKFFVNNDKNFKNQDRKTHLIVNATFPSGTIKSLDTNGVFAEFSAQGYVWLSNETKKQYLREFAWWLKVGGGGAVMNSIQGCEDRVFIQTVSPHDKENSYEELQRTFFHEAYHAYQKDLNSCPEVGDNDYWLIEGGASYFAEHVVSWAQGQLENFSSNLLEITHWMVHGIGVGLDEQRNPHSNVHYGAGYQGMGALRLMVELGWLDEMRILDSSLFHDCSRIKEFKDNDPKIQFVKNHWNEIEEKNGIFQFKESALYPNL